ncbi:hypothetical protein IGI04_005809 [Brassica rapa subsp. trilocularis]|uniref:DUF3700 domain-containing protein n=1 Tax=Brassica rapa subsp. trilocularis TaxID=1813537 RepID=A0ABQ7NF20_BRACM|nr:hypothetical protein IGI04_005809 [Brassica rapa subsp. trilocularis]
MSLRSEFRTSGCVWDAKFLEGGDIVTACSGGVAGIWTVRDGMIADQMEIDAYDYQLSQYKLCRKKVGGMKHDELLGIDALITLRDRGPVDQVVRDFQRMFAFVLSDCTTTNVFLAGISFIFATFLFVLTYCSPEVYVLQDADGRVSPYFGEHMYPLNKLKPVLRVDSSDQVCSVTFKVDSKAKKEGTTPRVGSIQNWDKTIEV